MSSRLFWAVATGIALGPQVALLDLPLPLVLAESFAVGLASAWEEVVG